MLKKWYNKIRYAFKKEIYTKYISNLNEIIQLKKADKMGNYFRDYVINYDKNWISLIFEVYYYGSKNIYIQSINLDKNEQIDICNRKIILS